jgi:hypothetical protein
MSTPLIDLPFKVEVVMKNIACKLEHSFEAEVTTSFAWSWRTDIKNWDDPPAQFQFDGPFASGSWGRTLFSTGG